MATIQEYVNGLPNICGEEKTITRAALDNSGSLLAGSGIDFKNIRACAAIALHMQQPLIPAGGDRLETTELISNLKYMMDHQDIGDNHNAPVFEWCYKRIGEFIPQLVGEGKNPRVMLDYSGCLLHGLRQMGADDVINKLRAITSDPAYWRCVEWLGCPWSHAVAPSTPVQDFRLHVQAWQQYFAALFGLDALKRVRGFSPAEMALPNQPDVAYEFVRTLKECGYQWVLVQEHSVERVENGWGIEQKHLPHRLVVTNSEGKTLSIIAIIKTQGSDTKLVAQMQPYYEALSLSRWELAGQQVPPLVSQIGDGENGGVMMNEFPPKYNEVAANASGSDVPLVNPSEYLEYLFSLGLTEEDFPAIQPVKQKMLWDRFTPGDGAEKMAKVIEEIRKENHEFHMDGGSWTNNISWVQGYDNVLGPMDKLSALFNEKVIRAGIPTTEERYRKALFYLLVSQTSCYRYWGQGLWTDYAREICRRGISILENDF
ncbi:MAG: glycosyl hydrolase family 57 [Spartobacteria bacterium]|nr:glycosyl hydrolase family 57 [Spartobacteria bacterium]